MATEIKIAKENVETYNLITDIHKVRDGFCLQHKQTCQRWLEFEEKVLSNLSYGDIRIEKKIKDLKQAIKIYEDAGI